MFTKDFLFGASMSGFQVEMGYAKGDLDPNTDWFVWVREPENLINGVVSGHLPEYGVGYWYNFPTIHKLASDFGMNVLRTNIEWSRIFPRPTFDVKVRVEQTESTITSVQIDERALRELDELADKEAVEHYREIFSDMRKKGLKVFVNLVHFTLPIWLHDPIAVHKRQATDKLGWANERSVVEFAKFAAYVVWKFDDLIDMYSTFNEPNIVSQLGYVMSVSGFPPGVFDTEKFFASFVNQIVAHARAYDVMKALTRKPVGLIYAASVYESTNNDAELEESVGQFMNFAFLDALNSGILLFQTREDLAGRLDFLGLNYYTRTVIQRSAQELSFGMVNELPNQVVQSQTLDVHLQRDRERNVDGEVQKLSVFSVPDLGAVELKRSRNSLKEFKVHRTITPVSAKTPCHMVALPIAAKIMNATFVAMARTMF
jgi:beta-galactosidase